MLYELTDSFIVSADLNSTWDFFSNAANLPKITPEWLGFTVLTPGPITIQKDTVIDYTIKWMGVKLKWQTLILDWKPKEYFTDLQSKGPYALWHHTHTFTPHPEGVLCTDRVLYKLPVPLIDGLVNALVVRKQLQQIFGFRQEVIGKYLGFVREVHKISIRGL